MRSEAGSVEVQQENNKLDAVLGSEAGSMGVQQENGKLHDVWDQRLVVWRFSRKW